MKSNPVRDILYVNAHLKFVEHILHFFDHGSEEMTLGEFRSRFKDKFGETGPLLDQYFGIYRLMPIILMKQVNLNTKKPLSGVYAQVKVMRDAIAHNDFEISETGYHFGSFSLTYSEFNAFLHRFENDFYKEHYP